MGWLKLFGVKTIEEIDREVSREPTIQQARVALKQADRILAQLEVIDRRRVVAKRRKVVP